MKRSAAYDRKVKAAGVALASILMAEDCDKKAAQLEKLGGDFTEFVRFLRLQSQGHHQAASCIMDFVER